MSYLLYAYIAFIAVAITAVNLFLTKPEESDPPLETVLDMLLLFGLLAGMLFFARDISHPTLKLAWRGVSVALLAYAVVSNLRGRKQALQEEPNADSESVADVDFMAVLMMGPSLVLNFMFAFS